MKIILNLFLIFLAGADKKISDSYQIMQTLKLRDRYYDNIVHFPVK